MTLSFTDDAKLFAPVRKFYVEAGRLPSACKDTLNLAHVDFAENVLLNLRAVDHARHKTCFADTAIFAFARLLAGLHH